MEPALQLRLDNKVIVQLFTLGRWLLLALCLGLALAAAGCRKNPADEPLTVTGAFPANGAVEVPEDAAIE